MDFIKEKKFTSAVITILIIMNIVTVYLLWAGRPERYDKQMPPNEKLDVARIHHLLKENLGFNEEQIKTYLDSRKKLAESVFEIEQQIRVTKREMFSMVLEKESEKQISDSLLNFILEKEADKEKLTYQHLYELQSVCTDEQRKALKGLMFELFGPEPPKGNPEGNGFPPPPHNGELPPK